MKKTCLSIVVLLFFSVIGLSSFAQQGKFKGIIKYTLTWEGEVPAGVPTSMEVKVYEEKSYFNNILSMFGEPTITNAEAKLSYSLFDFSQVPIEGATGKWYVRTKLEDDDIAKNKYEMTSETKEIAGRNARKVNVTFSKEDGIEVKESIWVCDEIGPSMDVVFYPGLKGMPFEFPVDADKFKIIFTASEIIEGKVKETDMLIPTGYQEQSQEEFKEILNIIFEAIGGGGEDI